MKILFAVSEIFPFFKTGGLADVTGALAQIFSQFEGNEVVVFVPKYKTSSSCVFSLKEVAKSYKVKTQTEQYTVKLFKVKHKKVTIYFVENAQYFDRANLYGTKRAGYADNDKRFIFFNKAILEGAKFIGFKPDIIYCHDWHTGLIPAYLKTLYNNDNFYKNTKTVFTIHNMAYQGFFSKNAFEEAGFPLEFFTPDALEYYGGINFLKSAILYSDIVTTVSPTYAKEVLFSHQISCGMDKVLNLRGKNFYGILNGVDDNVWNPKTDTLLVQNYDIDNFKNGKAVCKRTLQKNHNLTLNANIPLVAIVSRMDYQKGLDIAAKIIPHFRGKMQFAVLGRGDPAIEAIFKNLAKELKGSLFFANKLDETLAHNIYAACDIFLMPSRFEPCGLSQMIALKYGSPVVANKTGGLCDTINGYTQSSKPDGFFTNFLTENALADTISGAMICYGNKPLWYNIVKNAMRKNFSWHKSAQEYMKLFKSIRKVKNAVK